MFNWFIHCNYFHIHFNVLQKSHFWVFKPWIWYLKIPFKSPICPQPVLSCPEPIKVALKQEATRTSRSQKQLFHLFKRRQYSQIKIWQQYWYYNTLEQQYSKCFHLKLPACLTYQGSNRTLSSKTTRGHFSDRANSQIRSIVSFTSLSSSLRYSSLPFPQSFAPWRMYTNVQAKVTWCQRCLGGGD